MQKCTFDMLDDPMHKENFMYLKKCDSLKSFHALTSLVLEAYVANQIPSTHLHTESLFSIRKLHL